MGALHFWGIDNRVAYWCVSNSEHVEDCRTQFYLKLAETREDPVIDSIGVCLMHTFQDIYSERLCRNHAKLTNYL